MKNLLKLSTICLITVTILSFTFNKSNTNKVVFASLNDTSSNYFDGTYLGQSQAIYSGEPFWGHIQITLENGSFTNIQFVIRDSSTHEMVDSMYGVIHYFGNPGYMLQCVNGGHGIGLYPQRLLESQNLDHVDAITGATWSYNIFKATAKTALLNAKIPTGINNRNRADEIKVNVLPNPFYSTLTMEYSLPKNCHVNLSIYDNQGKLVKQLIDQEQFAGNYTIQWNDSPSAGIYYYRIQTDNSITCSKVIRLER
jgi:major membrane immunogen (membrane-anchored lipoprotein)